MLLLREQKICTVIIARKISPIRHAHVRKDTDSPRVPGHSKSRNEAMRNGKRGNEEMGRKHIAFYSANC